MLNTFATKIDQLHEKATKLIEKAQTQETDSDKLPEIIGYFDKIKE